MSFYKDPIWLADAWRHVRELLKKKGKNPKQCVALDHGQGWSSLMTPNSKLTCFFFYLFPISAWQNNALLSCLCQSQINLLSH